jgi:hypothetical protein
MATLLVPGCDDSPTEPLGAVPWEVVLAQDHVHLESLGDTFQLDVQVVDKSGQVIPNVPLSWTIDDPTVVEFLSGEEFRTLSNGHTTLHVTLAEDHPSVDPAGYRSGRLRGSLGVSVQQRPVALGLGPSTGPLAPGAALHLWALGQTAGLSVWTVDALGNPIDPLLSGTVWTSTDGSVSSVSSLGEVMATGDGAAAVLVTSEGLTGSIPLEVHAVLPLRACAVLEEGGQGGAEELCGEETLTFAEEGY